MSEHIIDPIIVVIAKKDEKQNISNKEKIEDQGIKEKKINNETNQKIKLKNNTCCICLEELKDPVYLARCPHGLCRIHLKV